MRDASTRRWVWLTVHLPPGRVEVEHLKDTEMRKETIVHSHGLSVYTFAFVDMEDFTLE